MDVIILQVRRVISKVRDIKNKYSGEIDRFKNKKKMTKTDEQSAYRLEGKIQGIDDAVEMFEEMLGRLMKLNK